MKYISVCLLVLHIEEALFRGTTWAEFKPNGWPLLGGSETRRTIPKAVREEVYERDGGRCVDCGSREFLQYDHLLPLARGGSNTADNIELRCAPRNQQKGGRI